MATLMILSAEAPGAGEPRAAVEAFLAVAGPRGAWMDGIAQLP